jgi:non-ribosomal peptide synthetase component E (peptide arylation enzyme)
MVSQLQVALTLTAKALSGRGQQGRGPSLPDGTIHLLGRGSSVINTGGKEVFAEEGEEVLKTFAGVLHAGVVGIDDDRD